MARLTGGLAVGAASILCPAYISEIAPPDIRGAFRQESEGLSREYEGSGLGLAVTRQGLDQMEGTIDVETEPGQGTCFTVWLPAVDERRLEEAA